MLDPQTERLAKSFARELWSRRNTWILLALVISAMALTFGLYLPKKYTTFASIVVENRNIVGPLMEGVAEQTAVADLAAIVSEVAFSRRLLEQILEDGGWLVPDMSPSQKEQEMQRIVRRTSIERRGANLIEVSYTDVDPARAFLVTKMYVDWIIAESRESKRRESMQAFDFIDSQVEEYHQKLLKAEAQLNEFRSKNMDALPESAAQVSARAMQLRREIETLRLGINELRVREATLAQQLSGEAEVIDTVGKQSEYSSRLAELQNQLDTLRLSYHDAYPDIVRIKGQISDLRQSIESGRAVGHVASSDGAGSNDQQVNPLFEELRSRLSETRTEQSTAKSRIRDLQSLLDKETERSQRISKTEGQMSEFTREYEVNNSIYQDLLRRRERARVSMSMDEQEQGLTMKVQEPPVVPQAPSGLRFFHVVLAGVAICLVVPFALSAALVQFDPRLRMKEQIENLGLPVLAVVSEMREVGGARVMSNMLFFVGLMLLAALYAVFAWIKLQGMG